MGRSRLLRLLSLILSFVLISAFPVSAMPPNEAALIRYLEAKGKIKPSMTQAEKIRYLQSYLQAKTTPKSMNRVNPIAMQVLKAKEKRGLTFLPGYPTSKTFNYNILVILVEFAGSDVTTQGAVKTGPMHNEIPEPGEEDNTSFWIPDFNRTHYESLLFSRKAGEKSLANYYYEQSGGIFSTTGFVTEWVKLPHSEWYYGADGEDIDNLNGPVWRVVADAIEKLGDSINWKQFDREDQYDLDGDGNYYEPDGYIDHLMIIHAGSGQEAGGGAQGEDAIWSHSWWVNFGGDENSPGGLGGVPCGTSGVWAGPYTIQPEDGTVGVFCHEFGHDLGLPDVYDTIYSGEESAGFWTLMSSGSWLGDKGKALGTSPSSMSIWEKYVLGYAEPDIVYPGKKKNVLIWSTGIKGTKGKAVRINLPSYSYTEEINEPYSGDYEWYSGRGDLIDHYLVLPEEFDLRLATSAELNFMTWYKIEEDWDYAYIEVSTDGGSTWQSIPGNITTDSNPNGSNKGNGITGDSSGWVQGVFDLSSFAGSKVKIRFRYVTDEYINEEGMTVDDIEVKIDGEQVFFDDVESEIPGYVSEGWQKINGMVEKQAFHYYMLEYRTPTGFDTSMKNWYNFVDYSKNFAEFFEANPGVLLWYRNSRYNDNWVGVHPYAGFLQLVDANPKLITATGSASDCYEWYGYDVEFPFRTRIQLFDAAFSLKAAKSGQVITSWFGLIYPTELPSYPPVRMFDDSKSYIDDTYYQLAIENNDDEFYLDVVTMALSSVKTPTYGVKWYINSMNGGSVNLTVDFTGR